MPPRPCFLAGPAKAQIAIVHTSAVQTTLRVMTPQLAHFRLVGKAWQRRVKVSPYETSNFR